MRDFNSPQEQRLNDARAYVLWAINNNEPQHVIDLAKQAYYSAIQTAWPSPRVPEEDTMPAPAIAHQTWGKLNFRVLEITGYRTFHVTDDFSFRVADARCQDTDTGHHFDLSLPLDDVIVEN